jgi:uncharacterized protein (TIGR03437 family)
MQLNAAGRVETTLGGTRVLFGGVAAPMIYAARGQVSAVVPYSVAAAQSTNVVVEYQGRSSAAMQVQVAGTAPGIFTLDASGRGQGAILNQDYTVNGAQNAAARGSAVMIYVTGEGQTEPAGGDGKLAGDSPPRPLETVTATIGGQSAEVLYAGGAPGLVAGVMQVNARVPAGAATGAAVPVLVKVGANQSPTGVTMAVR